MTDYKKIRLSPSFRKLRSIDMASIHHGSLNWLKAELERGKDFAQVVVTHHTSSRRSIPESYKKDILSAAYASDLEYIIEQSDIKLWIHGHLHKESDNCIGETRIICNPRGYPDERNEKFIPDLVVEV